MASFVSLFIPSHVVYDVGLPIREFFIWADDLEYTTALTLTLSGLAEPAALPMHLRADGSLCFVITLYHPGGGTTAEEIALP